MTTAAPEMVRRPSRVWAVVVLAVGPLASTMTVAGLGVLSRNELNIAFAALLVLWCPLVAFGFSALVAGDRRWHAEQTMRAGTPWGSSLAHLVQLLRGPAQLEALAATVGWVGLLVWAHPLVAWYTLFGLFS
jgi:hypothetical protein